MSARDAMAERHGALLGELADLSMTLVRHLHGRALAAQDDAAGDLALAFQRVSRSLRQTLALESRLERERRQAEREAAQAVARETRARVHRRRSQVRAALAPLIWTEGEDDEERENLLEALDSCLFDASEDEAFLEAPLEAAIARIRADLGLPADNDAHAAEAPDVVIWRSSA